MCDNYPFLRLFINLGGGYNAIASCVERDPERAIQAKDKHGFDICEMSTCFLTKREPLVFRHFQGV